MKSSIHSITIPQFTFIHNSVHLGGIYPEKEEMPLHHVLFSYKSDTSKSIDLLVTLSLKRKQTSNRETIHTADGLHATEMQWINRLETSKEEKLCLHVRYHIS